MSMDTHELETEMGEAINFENVLTIITVLLLLRTIFMVPLINIEKVRMEMVVKDGFWASLAGWIPAHPAPHAASGQYAAALEADAGSLLVSDLAGGKARYVETVTANGDLHVVAHDLARGTCMTMVVQDGGGAIHFRQGVMKWSARDREWFIDGGAVIHAGDPAAKQMLANYRQWVKQSRGL